VSKAGDSRRGRADVSVRGGSNVAGLGEIGDRLLGWRDLKLLERQQRLRGITT